MGQNLLHNAYERLWKQGKLQRPEVHYTTRGNTWSLSTGAQPNFLVTLLIPKGAVLTIYNRCS